MTTNFRQAVEVYTQGTKAWFEDDKEAWISTTCVSNTITDDSQIRIVFQCDNAEKVKKKILPSIKMGNQSSNIL